MAKQPGSYLIISTFPPHNCGIGAYADQQCVALKQRGHAVYRMGLSGDSCGHYSLNPISFKSTFKAALMGLCRRYKGVYLHFSDGLMLPDPPGKGLRTWLQTLLPYGFMVLLSLVYGKRLKLVMHEKILFHKRSWYRHIGERVLFFFCRRLIFHTPSERQTFLSYYKLWVSKRQTQLQAHEKFMQPRFRGNKWQARYRMGVQHDAVVLLCIGFWQRHKGFHTAIEAMKGVDNPRVKLYVVGSGRAPSPDIKEYCEEIKQAAANCSNVVMVERFINDEEFDAYLLAADRLVLPYEHIWSSGVAARAKMLGVPVIIRHHPNLISQLEQPARDEDGPEVPSPGFEIFHDTSQLTSLFNAVGSREGSDRFINGPVVPEQVSDAYAAELYAGLRVLFIIPTFGTKVRGGAEKFCLELACALHRRGVQLEVWCTDSDSVSPRNRFAAVWDDRDVPFKVRRFPANCADQELWDQVHHRLNNGSATLLSRTLWTRYNLSGVGMEAALKKHQQEFDVVHLFHYLAGTSHRLAGVVPHKTLIHPFIHDESIMRDPIMRGLFAKVTGATCNTPASAHLALFSQMGMPFSRFRPIGNAVAPYAGRYDSAIEGIERIGDQPYMLFVGRLIHEKNAALLHQWHQEMWESSEGKAPWLVMVGEGPLREELRGEGVLHTGWLEKAQLHHLLKNSLCLVNLSCLESFSLVIMEAWLEGVPVMIHDSCAATKYHMGQCAGGFSVSSSAEWSSAVQALVHEEGLRSELGSRGRRYVMEHYSEDRVCKNYVLAVRDLLGILPPPPHKSFQHLDGEQQVKPLDSKEASFRQVVGHDYYYRFEEIFRGFERIPPSFPHYVDELADLPAAAKVVDIGAGCGHFLEYLKGHRPDLDVFGVEPDYSSYVTMRQRGIPGACMTVEEFAQQIQPSSIDVAVMLHVVEHIPWRDLAIALHALAHCLKPHGRLIIEMPNVSSSRTASVLFWTDPTHIRPIVPDTLNFLLNRLGFQTKSRPEFAPHPQGGSGEGSGEGLEHLSRDFYGNQDVGMICEKLSF